MRTDGRTDGRADGRKCNDIVLSRHDRKTHFEKHFREFEKSYVCICGRTDTRTDGRTDGRTDIVLSRHDRKKICVEKYFRESKKILQVPVLGIFSEISLSPQT